MDTGAGAEARATTNIVEFSVSELSGALKRTVEAAFGHVRVRGEISGYRGPHPSGHCYFALKDERARLEAVIWRATAGRLRYPPEEGMEVIATGRLTIYPGSSKYQIVIESLEPAGAGALMAMLEARKQKLAAEGLFDAARKKKLPYLPRVIGVVTSPTGAVIRDIVHRISDRFPLHVLVWPIRVQGETCGAEATAAIAGFNALVPGGAVPRPDLIIVARGGGSLEDLWGFNDEALARAAAASGIPVISAVGHETDWTLLDHVADLRAPTPTAAAELAVPVQADLAAMIAGFGARQRAAISRGLDRKRQMLRSATRALPGADQLLALPRRDLDELSARLQRALGTNIERKRLHHARIRLSPHVLARMTRERRQSLRSLLFRLRPEPLLDRVRHGRERTAILMVRADRCIVARIESGTGILRDRARLMASLSPDAVLARGYVMVHGLDGKLRTHASQIHRGAGLRLRFQDGEVQAVAGGGGARRQRAAEPEGQASLFGEAGPADAHGESPDQ